MNVITNSKKQPSEDWPSPSIIAELKIRTGLSLRQLAYRNGYAPATLRAALDKPYPNMERIIAHAVGVEPKEIWPSRYDIHGKSNRPMGRPVRNQKKNTTPKQRRNAKSCRED